MNRLFWLIVFILSTFSLVACSGSSSSSADEPEEIKDDDVTQLEDSLSENGSSGVVKLDSLGRPISSALGSASRGPRSGSKQSAPTARRPV